MDQPTNYPIHKDEHQTRQSLFAGILIWFLHLNLLYGLSSLSCKWGWFSAPNLRISGLQMTETAITMIAIALMVVMIYRPWREWRKFQTKKQTDNPHLLQDTEKHRRPLLAFVVMLMNSLFLLFLIASFVPIYALNACGQG